MTPTSILKRIASDSRKPLTSEGYQKRLEKKASEPELNPFRTIERQMGRTRFRREIHEKYAVKESCSRIIETLRTYLPSLLS